MRRPPGGRPGSLIPQKRPFGPQNGVTTEAASGAKPVHIKMLFTRQMTQKHKKWVDGVLVVGSGGVATVHEEGDGHVKVLGHSAVDTKHLSHDDLTALVGLGYTEILNLWPDLVAPGFFEDVEMHFDTCIVHIERKEAGCGAACAADDGVDAAQMGHHSRSAGGNHAAEPLGSTPAPVPGPPKAVTSTPHPSRSRRAP